MTNEASIVVVVVNYFNDKEVMNFITRELDGQSLDSISIYLVNNGSTNARELNVFCTSHPRATLIDINKNTGYLGGFNLALDHHLQNHPLPAFAILSNTDICIGDKDFLQRLSGTYSPSLVGIIGPSIISTATLHDQNPMYTSALSISKMKMLKFFFSYYLVYTLYQLASVGKNFTKSLRKNGSTVKAREVYAVHGSFMIFTQRFLELATQKIKGGPFLFGEEIYLAEVCASIGLKTVYDPSFMVRHSEHQTTGLFKSRKTLKMMRDSVVHWLRFKEMKN